MAKTCTTRLITMKNTKLTNKSMPWEINTSPEEQLQTTGKQSHWTWPIHTGPLQLPNSLKWMDRSRQGDTWRVPSIENLKWRIPLVAYSQATSTSHLPVTLSRPHMSSIQFMRKTILGPISPHSKRGKITTIEWIESRTTLKRCTSLGLLHLSQSRVSDQFRLLPQSQMDNLLTNTK